LYADFLIFETILQCVRVINKKIYNKYNNQINLLGKNDIILFFSIINIIFKMAKKAHKYVNIIKIITSY